MTEMRQLYKRLAARTRLALRAGDPGAIAAFDALYRVFGSQLGKTKAQVAKDVGLTTQRYVQLVYGDPDEPSSAPARSDGDDADAGDRGA